MPNEIKFEESEIILPAAIEQIKRFNEQLAKERGKKYCAKDQLLKRVLLVDINDGTDVVDTKDRLAKRAANILAYMIKRTPFCSLNSDTGIAIVLGYLNANKLPMVRDRRIELFELLEKHHTERVRELRNRIEKLIRQSI